MHTKFLAVAVFLYKLRPDLNQVLGWSVWGGPQGRPSDRRQSIHLYVVASHLSINRESSKEDLIQNLYIRQSPRHKLAKDNCKKGPMN